MTAVTGPANVQLVSDLGADRVIDYTRTDVTTLPERFDVVLDTVGNLTTATGRQLLAPGGVVLLAAADLWQLLTARGDVRAGAAPERAQDIELLLGMVEAGTLRVVIDQVHPLPLIAEGYRRIDSGRKVGNVVVRPQRP